MSFVKGDKVLINGGVGAEILIYDTDANIIVYEAKLAGGATDTVTAHVSNTRVEYLAGQTVESVTADAPPKSPRNAVSNDSHKAAEIVAEDEAVE